MMKKRKEGKKTMTKYGKKRETWESGIEVLESVLIVIPQKILSVCDYIAETINSSDEFSILCSINKELSSGRNGEFSDIIYLTEEFYIPKQEVGPASVDYLDDPEAHKYDTVIHRHPDGMHSFSGTDREYINQNFTLSILYTKPAKFVHGIYNVRVGDFLIPLPIEMEIDNGIDKIDISMIRKRSYVSHSYSYGELGYDGTDYGRWQRGWDKLCDEKDKKTAKENSKKGAKENIKEGIKEDITSTSWEYGSFSEEMDKLDKSWNTDGKDGKKKKEDREELEREEFEREEIEREMMDRIEELEDELELTKGELFSLKMGITDVLETEAINKVEEAAQAREEEYFESFDIYKRRMKDDEKTGDSKEDKDSLLLPPPNSQLNKTTEQF